MHKIRVIDSHTAGEPTRVALEDAFTLRGATMAERRADFSARLDHLRAGMIREPRGSDVLVGAVLTPPVSQDAEAGVIFFNNVGMLGMCGHGTIGVIETLRHLGRIVPGPVKLDTPVGPVTAVLRENGEVAVRNVTSYRYLSAVEIEVDGLGKVRGDVSYGGNWFFLVHEPVFDIGMGEVRKLTDLTALIRQTLEQNGITGKDGATIDHIELGGPPVAPEANSRNFVLCPGIEYDRSPCGTGTSAKLASLYAAGLLKAGESYVQESVTGGIFSGSVEPVDGGVIPTIVGRAYVTAESTLLFSESDPLRWGTI
jgi:proline racemase